MESCVGTSTPPVSNYNYINFKIRNHVKGYSKAFFGNRTLMNIRLELLEAR